MKTDKIIKMKKYKVFHREWWRKNPEWDGGMEPMEPSRTIKHTIGYADTEKEAIQMCQKWNENNEEGKYSDRAEYMKAIG